jgi:hypothetical protein
MKWRKLKLSARLFFFNDIREKKKIIIYFIGHIFKENSKRKQGEANGT